MASAMKKGAKNKGGRPSEFREEYCELARNYCLLGATDKDLATFFEKDEATINRWKKAHPQFREALKEGKARADAMVAQKLYSKAIGYSHIDTKFATFEGQITDAREYIKNYAPDTVACIFWLKNRRPDLWRDKQEVEETKKTEMVISEETEERIIAAAKVASQVEPPASFNGVEQDE